MNRLGWSWTLDRERAEWFARRFSSLDDIQEVATGKLMRQADENNVVLSVEGGGNAYRKEPCQECPWRRSNDGSFPAEAFRHSAETAYDLSQRTFGCHMSGPDHPAVCAGFILGAQHNMALRLACARGAIDPKKVTDGDADLHPDYRSMAVANGVDPDDPVIAPCR